MSPLADGAVAIARHKGCAIYEWTLGWTADSTGGAYELEVQLYPRDWRGESGGDRTSRIYSDGRRFVVFEKDADECWTKMQRRLQAELP